MNENTIEKEAHFADAHYEPYQNDLKVNQEFFRRYAAPRYLWNWRERAASFLGNIDGKHLLDYGCGMGEETIYFAKMGAHVTAIDISLKGIEITRARAVHNNVADLVNALVMDADAMDLPAETFDIVHGLGILHHVGLEQGLIEVRRVLKPGGKAIFLEPMENSEFIRRLKVRAFRWRHKSRDVTEHEDPLKLRELRKYANQFSHFKCYPYHLSYRLRRLLPSGGFQRYLKVADYYLLRAAPILSHLAGGVVIHIAK